MLQSVLGMLLQMCYAVDNSNNRPAKDAGFAERRLFMERIIFHIDVNSAYLSWSAIDLLKKNPDSVDIRTIPAIIGGNRKTRHALFWQSLCRRKTGIIFTPQSLWQMP